MARAILRAAQSKARANGLDLDVGEFPEKMTLTDGADDNPTQLVDTVAHAVARIGDRFSFMRKLSRHAEGKEKRAGIVSDVVSALVVIYNRNPDLMEELGSKVKDEMNAKRAARAAQEASKPKPVDIRNGRVVS